MKNTWNIRKKEDAVSPVIATILMVAITVVLAAVLYVMVIGFGGESTTTPAGAWNGAEATTQTAGKITFGKFTSDVKPLDIKIFVTVNGTAKGAMTIPSNTGASPQTITWTGVLPVDGADKALPPAATYTDYNAAGGLVNAGDYISFTNLLPGSTYSFEIFHVPSESTISMTGISGQFQTPA